MSVTEKAAYLKGLAEGLEITPDTKEGKLLLAVLDLLDDMALSIADLEDETAQIGEQVDMIDEDLSDLEDDYYDLDSDDEDDEDGCGCGCQDEPLYEIVCPKCGDSIYVDEGMLDEGSMHCPTAMSCWSLTWKPGRGRRGRGRLRLWLRLPGEITSLPPLFERESGGICKNTLDYTAVQGVFSTISGNSVSKYAKNFQFFLPERTAVTQW